jgi:hypothetical protein
MHKQVTRNDAFKLYIKICTHLASMLRSSVSNSSHSFLHVADRKQADDN